MKTIIKEGKLRNYKHICSNCGCEFRYDSSDIEKETIDCGFRITKTWITCPMCKEQEESARDIEIE